ncbi:MAG: hypothetical protein H6733_00850 [Alphaproteobacteria bacterium]|nr:hypothetical protein [Alphaproteobacteria bacterium]
MRPALLLAAALAVAGCPKRGGVDAAAAVQDDTVYLDTPYTAAQIHDAMPVGTHIQLKSKTPEGQRRFDWVVIEADTQGTNIRYHELSGTGQILEGPTESWSDWTELQAHARYPAADATRSRVAFPSAFGPLSGWMYVVQGVSDDEAKIPQVRTYWFADAFPGPPMLITITEDDLEVFRMEQVLRDHVTP